MLHLPSVFKSIGKPFTRQGVLLVAVRRPEMLHHREACRGCFFKDVGCSTSLLACSSFDRRDGVSVWFQAIEDTNK